MYLSVEGGVNTASWKGPSNWAMAFKNIFLPSFLEMTYFAWRKSYNSPVFEIQDILKYILINNFIYLQKCWK